MEISLHNDCNKSEHLYPKVSLSPAEMVKALADDQPRIIRDASGKLDIRATLATSPLTRLFDEKERAALHAQGDHLSDNAFKLDPFERRLFSLGIKGNMTWSAALSVLFDPTNRGVFPEFVERAVLLSENLLADTEVAESDLIANTIPLASTSTEVTKLEMQGTTGTGDRKVMRTTEGATMRQYVLTHSETTVATKEYGFSLGITDRARLLSTVDQVNLLIQELALENVNRSSVSDALTVLIAAVTETRALALATTLTWKDVLLFFYGSQFTSTRTPNLIISTNDYAGAIISFVNLLALANFTDPIGNPNNATQNIVPLVRNAKLKFYPGSTLSDKLLGVRTSSALNKYENRSLMQSEWERLASSQSDAYYWRTNRVYYCPDAKSVRTLTKT